MIARVLRKLAFVVVAALVGLVCMTEGMAQKPATAGATNPVSSVGGTALAAGFGLADLTSDLSTYRLRVGDVLDIKVYQEDDLTTPEARINQEGVIALPLLGSVAVVGLTPDEAKSLIAKRYDAEYVINPQVLMTVKAFAPRRFSVGGEVSKPGVYEIPAREKVNLLQAIALAGGYGKLADPTKVRIRRITEKGEEILKFNAKALAAEAAEKIPEIVDGDNINVGVSVF